MKRSDELGGAHAAALSCLLTLLTAIGFFLCVMAGAPAEWRHVAAALAGYLPLMVVGFLVAHKRGIQAVFPPAFSECRFCIGRGGE